MSFLPAIAGCSQLALFNAVVPQDADGVRVASDVAYRDGPRGMLDIYRDAGQGSGLPVIVFVYGGSWSSGDKDDYAFAASALASRGHVTVVADYRLVPDVRYPEFVTDTAEAVAWTYRNIASFGGDPERLYLVGHSAGAYNAAMVAMEPEFLAGAGLGREIIDGFAGLSGPYDFLPLDTDSTRTAFAGVADLPSTQPVRLDPRGAPPMLLVTGDADTLVRPRNTTALAAHLEESGIRVETKIYPDLDHADTLLALSRPFRDSAPVLGDIDAFFESLD